MPALPRALDNKATAAPSPAPAVPDVAATRPVSDLQLSRLDEFVTSKMGLHFPKRRHRELERLVAQAGQELGFPNTGSCIEWLVSGQATREQVEILASHLTIGETYFFRDQKSFEILEQNILPELIRSRRGKDQRLRIWSAGCSTGEEPYSIAILLSRIIPDLSQWSVTIHATDINPRAVAKARKATYGTWSFRGVPDWMRERYFTRTSEGKFELRQSIRKMVSFSVLNLVDDPYPSLSTNTNAIDIIFCRNVLMYFKADQQVGVLQNFHRCLLNGGWLALSPCEISPASAQFDPVSFPGAIFYRKGDSRQSRRDAVYAAPDPLPLITPPPAKVSAPSHPKSNAVPQQTAQVARQPEPGPYERALALYRQGDYRTAAQLISGLLDEPSSDRSPSFQKAAVLFVHALANCGELEKALLWADKAISANKLNAELYYLRATIMQERSAFNEAITSLKQAIFIDHAFVPAHFTLGNLTLRQGKSKEAEKHFANALSLLRLYKADDPIPGAEGMTAEGLAAIIASSMGNAAKR